MAIPWLTSTVALSWMSPLVSPAILPVMVAMPVPESFNEKVAVYVPSLLSVTVEMTPIGLTERVIVPRLVVSRLPHWSLS